MKRFVLILTILLYLAVSSYAAECKLKFGVFPYTSPQEIVKIYSVIAKKMEIKTGCEVLLSSATDFNDFMAKMKSNWYDIAVPSPVAMAKLMNEKSNYSVIAMGHPSFHGGVIVRDDSSIKTLDDIKNKRIGAVSQNSYGGYGFFKKVLAERGVNSETDNQVVFLQKTDNIVLSVVNGKVDVGVTRLDVLDRAIYNNIKSRIKVIYKSNVLLQFPVVLSKSVYEKYYEKILDALLKCDEKILSDSDIGFDKFVKSDNNNYLDLIKQSGIK